MEIIDELAFKNGRGRNSGKTVDQRYWEDVDKKGEDECWPWLGLKNEDGYGEFFWNGKRDKAHRYAYIMAYGEIPKDKPYVLHTCHNPSCVNHNHLYAGTQQDNMNDMYNAGRERHPRGEEHANHIFTWKIIKQIRKENSETDITQEELAKEYNTSRRSIYLILNNKIWIDENYKPTHKSPSRGEHNTHAKLNWQQVKDIREKGKTKEQTYQEIADEYGVSRSTIDYIMRNKSWPDKEYQEYLDIKHKNKKK